MELLQMLELGLKNFWTTKKTFSIQTFRYHAKMTLEYVFLSVQINQQNPR